MPTDPTAGPHPEPLTDAYAPVPSPCVGLCRMDAADRWCEGCLRSRDEIAVWSQLSPREQRALCAQLPSRRAHLAALQTAPAPDA